MNTQQPERQSAEAIERFLEAREATKVARDDAAYQHDRAAHLLAGCVMNDFPAPEEWRQEYRDTEKALEEARAAHQTARVEWWHSMGKHAHKNLAQCCQPEDDAR